MNHDTDRFAPLDATEIMRIAASSYWVPPDSERLTGDGFVMVRYDNGFAYDTSVHEVDSERPAAELFADVLSARLAAATERGCEAAIVGGRLTTSAPILTRAGFRRYGEEFMLRVPVDPLTQAAPHT